MSIDRPPYLRGVPQNDMLPTRQPTPTAADAEARLLQRVVAGGVRGVEGRATAVIGAYRTVRYLGRGGMGEVWEAVGKDGAPVAIKLLRASAAAHEPTRKRFLREARTAAAVRHPRIVRIFDVGTTAAGTPFIVMEKLAGQPLETFVRALGPLPWSCAREILLQVADALAFAHARGVIHRDLKPANVMVRGGIEAPSCTIIDFGLARREVVASGSEALSITGEIFGSPPFMSPEQFRGNAADGRSDLYSYGCLMFYVLTGRRPFTGENIGELMYMHLFEPAPPPTGMDCPARLTPALTSITLRALRKAPEDRFASMDELAARLRTIEEDPRPVRVPREPALGVTPRRGFAHRFALPAVAMLGLFGAVIVAAQTAGDPPGATPPEPTVDPRHDLPAVPTPPPVRAAVLSPTPEPRALTPGAERPDETPGVATRAQEGSAGSSPDHGTAASDALDDRAELRGRTPASAASSPRRTVPASNVATGRHVAGPHKTAGVSDARSGPEPSATSGGPPRQERKPERPTHERPTPERPTDERPTHERPTHERPTHEQRGAPSKPSRSELPPNPFHPSSDDEHALLR